MGVESIMDQILVNGSNELEGLDSFEMLGNLRLVDLRISTLDPYLIVMVRLDVAGNGCVARITIGKRNRCFRKTG